MPRQQVPARVVNSGPFVLLTGAVGTVIPLFAFVLSDDVRTWVENNGTPVFWIAFTVVALLVIALEIQRIEVDPDQRDVDLMARFRENLGGDGDLMRWVRDWFAPNRFSAARWHELEDVYRVWEEDASRKFKDKKVQRALTRAITSLGEFISRTGDDTWPRDTRENDPGNLGLPPEWKDDAEMRKRYYKAAEEINAARGGFVKAHIALLETAHERGL